MILESKIALTAEAERGSTSENRTDNQFRERNFATTWGMVALIVVEIGGFGVLFAGFLLRV